MRVPVPARVLSVLLLGQAALPPLAAFQTPQLFVKPYTVLAAGVSPGIAPGAEASVFGDNLAPITVAAEASAPYPTTLGTVSLHVTDSAGVTREARLLYVSPSQINYIVPTATAAGPATLRTSGGSNISLSVHVDTVLPLIFTADADGRGVVAATAVRQIAPNAPKFAVPVFQCDAPGQCSSVPIDPGVLRHRDAQSVEQFEREPHHRRHECSDHFDYIVCRE